MPYLCLDSCPPPVREGGSAVCCPCTTGQPDKNPTDYNWLLELSESQSNRSRLDRPARFELATFLRWLRLARETDLKEGKGSRCTNIRRHSDHLSDISGWRTLFLIATLARRDRVEPHTDDLAKDITRS